LTIEEAAMLVGMVNAPTSYNPRRNPENALIRRNTVLARMREMGAIDRHQLDSLQALPITLAYQRIAHDTGSGTYFAAELKKYMTAERPKREGYENIWDYETAARTWDEDPLYGWVRKNPKADGTLYNLDRDGLKIYTTINAAMQRYAEQSLYAHMTDLQKEMDAQNAGRKNPFRNISQQETDRILTNAMRQTDRYRGLKRAGESEEAIRQFFEEE
jgi:penicillin-binding protein 1A